MRELRRKVRFHTVTDWEDVDRLFKEIIASSAQALMPINPPLAAIKGYVALALRHRLPSASLCEKVRKRAVCLHDPAVLAAFGQRPCQIFPGLAAAQYKVVETL
jgi:hypothetical protein